MAKVITSKIGSKLQYYALLVSACSLPLPLEFNRWALTLFAVISVLVYDWASFKGDIIKNRRILLCCLIGLMNIFGMIYTSEQENGWPLVERTSVTIAIPILLMMTPLSKLDLDKLIRTFIFTCTLLAVYCILFSLLKIYETGSFINLEKISDRQYYYFINAELTKSAININPIYFSLYINFCIAFLLIQLFLRKRTTRTSYILLVFLNFFQLLVFSLNGIVTLIIIWLIVISKLIKETTPAFNRIKIVLLAMLAICLGGIAGTQIDPLRNRIHVDTTYDFQNAHISYWNGITMRLAVWSCAWQAVKETPFYGNGTGDAALALNNKYAQNKFSLAQNLKLNAHNQFLQTYLMHGAVGSVVLLLITLIPLLDSFKEKNWILQMFIVIMVVGFLSEVLLSVQKGIVFFSIFFPLLYIPDHK